MKKLLLIALIALSSCTQKSCTRYKKNSQFSDRYYKIEQYSGGRLIDTYEFKGILNDAEGSDGYYFFKGDTLIEVSGDLTIKSW